MHKFDTFSKPLQEFQVKTRTGGYLSILSIGLIIYLLLSEIVFFLEVEQKDEMIVDLNQDSKQIKIQLDLWLPDVPCSIVALNLVHQKNQENVMNVGHTILKQRMQKKDAVWETLGKPIRSGLHRISASAGEFNDNLSVNLGGGQKSLEHSTRKQRCMSCFGAKNDEDDCCNDCDQLKAAFKLKGWAMAEDHVAEQCQSDSGLIEPVEAEGCKMTSRILARKVPAYLQVGLGYDFDMHLLHEAFIEKARKGYISFTHTIDKLSFGPIFPGFIPVLDGLERKHDHVPLIESWSEEKLESQSEHWQYDLHLIPTDFVTAFGQVTESHQYSSTQFVKGLNVVQRHRELPAAGIYLKYEFTAFRVRWIQSYKSVSHFLTNICAILGGIYAFFSMVDSVLYQLLMKGGCSASALSL